MVYSQPTSASSVTNQGYTRDVRSSLSTNGESTVHFDETGMLRILPQEQGGQAEALQGNATQFDQSILGLLVLDDAMS